MTTLQERIAGSPISPDQRLTVVEQRLAKIEEYLKPPPASDGPSKPDLILEKVTLIEQALGMIWDEIKALRQQPAPPSGRA